MSVHGFSYEYAFVKKNLMNNQQVLWVINYIKVREAWKNALRNKSSALTSVWGGLFRFGVFLAYWAVERVFLKKEIEEMLLRNSDYKYVFWLSLALGLWGIVDALIGAYKYFQANQEAEKLRKQVEDLERELV